MVSYCHDGDVTTVVCVGTAVNHLRDGRPAEGLWLYQVKRHKAVLSDNSDAANEGWLVSASKWLSQLMSAEQCPYFFTKVDNFHLSSDVQASFNHTLHKHSLTLVRPLPSSQDTCVSFQACRDSLLDTTHCIVTLDFLRNTIESVKLPCSSSELKPHEVKVIREKDALVVLK